MLCLLNNSSNNFVLGKMIYSKSWRMLLLLLSKSSVTCLAVVTDWIEDVAPLDKLVVAWVDKLDDWIKKKRSFSNFSLFLRHLNVQLISTQGVLKFGHIRVPIHIANCGRNKICKFRGNSNKRQCPEEIKEKIKSGANPKQKICPGRRTKCDGCLGTGADCAWGFPGFVPAGSIWADQTWL